jgi:hypothetical protein
MTNPNPHKSRKKAMGSIIRVSGVSLILNIVYKLYCIIKREARKYPFFVIYLFLKYKTTIKEMNSIFEPYFFIYNWKNPTKSFF